MAVHGARSRQPRAGRAGFALVACMMLLALLATISLGLLSLAAIEVRRAGTGDDATRARANARLALLEAVGRLQQTLGPDQRVCASADLLDDPAHPHWTGVWSTRAPDGRSFYQRNPDTGSLADARTAGYDRATAALAWLVSGGARPDDPLPADRSAELVGPGSVGDRPADRVRAPWVTLAGAGGPGRFAWWVGDLGARANLATPDRHAAATPQPATPEDGGYFRVMLAQDCEAAAMEHGTPIDPADRARIVSAATAALAGTDAEWPRARFHDFTATSLGVLADARDGGLKHDLSAWLASDGTVPALGDRPGLADTDRLVAPATEDGAAPGAASRFERTSPCFGVLRDWARAAVPFSGKQVPAITPETDTRAGAASARLALCNAAPARLENPRRDNLGPVLVEATNFIQISTFAKTSSSGATLYQIRQHNYPRVVLWNPYNVELAAPAAIVMIQGNGRQEMWTESIYNGSTLTSQWLMFEGGRSTRFDLRGLGIMDTEGYNDPYMGSYYFSLPATRFGPGECLVFSPARSAEYDGLSVYRPGSYNLANNALSCDVAPDPSRSYYVSDSEIDGGVPFRPVTFWFAPTPAWSRDGRGVVNQADDPRVVMKDLTGVSTVTFEGFDRLPQLAYVSASLQYGAGREPRFAWNRAERMPIELLDRANPRPTVVPNVRTREGIRLRWFDEHPSNLLNAGPLAHTPFAEEAPLATWNLRASYALRSPWDNIAGTLPVGGGSSGPWFFGIYTRDLYDQAVSWPEQAPVPRAGRYHGNPFGPPQEGRPHMVTFDLPRTETGVVSLGQLQQAKLSELVWHPSLAIANSLADPRLGLDGLTGTVPAGAAAENRLNGFHRDAIGWSSDTQRASGRDDWATTGRTLLHQLPNNGNLVYDLSFEANHSLWDRYFLSSGNPAAIKRFAADPHANPLPNGRMVPTPGTGADAAALADFHRAAAALMVDGAFNVNSTRVEAWKALLASARDCGFPGSSGTPYPRVLDAPAGAWHDGASADAAAAWSGFRELTDDEIGRLAAAIVDEVRRRGPFLSLADFVNRRLATDDTGRCGALQAAIDRAGLNTAFEQQFPLDHAAALPDYRHPDNIRDATRLEQRLKPATKAWGAPGFLTQGDLLSSLGPALAARSDTFLVRACGEALGPDGQTRARAWCEAVVQRLPEPLQPDETGLNPRHPGDPRDFGRRFVVTSFRWLQPEEV